MKMSMEHWRTLSQFNPKSEDSEHWSSDRHFRVGGGEWGVGGEYTEHHFVRSSLGYARSSFL